MNSYIVFRKRLVSKRLMCLHVHTIAQTANYKVSVKENKTQAEDKRRKHVLTRKQ
jgi:hypothetical protein